MSACCYTPPPLLQYSVCVCVCVCYNQVFTSQLSFEDVRSDTHQTKCCCELQMWHMNVSTIQVSSHSVKPQTSVQDRHFHICICETAGCFLTRHFPAVFKNTMFFSLWPPGSCASTSAGMKRRKFLHRSFSVFLLFFFLKRAPSPEWMLVFLQRYVENVLINFEVMSFFLCSGLDAATSRWAWGKYPVFH